jgi:hypothetical protein
MTTDTRTDTCELRGTDTSILVDSSSVDNAGTVPRLGRRVRVEQVVLFGEAWRFPGDDS